MCLGANNSRYHFRYCYRSSQIAAIRESYLIPYPSPTATIPCLVVFMFAAQQNNRNHS
jgi:hypothetical protein